MSEQRATYQAGNTGDPSGFATAPDPQRQIVPHVSIPDPAVRAALKAARKRIADPERWCCGAEALDGHGCRIAAFDPRAVRWSGIGALKAVTGYFWPEINLCYEQAASAYRAAEQEIYPISMSVAQVHALGHAAILRCYDHAIQGLAEDG